MDCKMEIVDPIGISGGMMLGWSEKIKVRQVVTNGFCFEVELEETGMQGTYWGIF